MLVSIRKQGVGVIVKRVKIVIFRPYKKNFLFPIPARVTFEERIKKNFIFYFIEFDVYYGTTMVEADPFCPLF